MNTKITIIGAGSVGSFITLSLAKMGFSNLEVFDDDVVAPHNLPNQFYRIKDLGKPKVKALAEIIYGFEDIKITTHNSRYTGQLLTSDIIISAVDSIPMRREIWEKQGFPNSIRAYIDTRMGGDMMRIYTVTPSTSPLRYMDTLQGEGEQLPCTARTILYNVLTIAGLTGSVVKKIVNDEQVPFGINFSMATYQTIMEA